MAMLLVRTDPVRAPIQSGRPVALRRLARLGAAVVFGILGLGSALVAWFAGFAGYARVQGEQLLDHKTRATVTDRIRADPGATVAELATDLRIPYNTVNYHVERLRQEGLLDELASGKRRHLFPVGVARADRTRLVAMRNANTVRLLAAIRASPGVSQRQLAAAIHLKPTSLPWHLARLQESGLVQRVPQGRVVAWFPIETSDARGLHAVDATPAASIAS